MATEADARFPRYLVQTPHDGLVLMTEEDAARSIDSGGGRLLDFVQTDESHMRLLTRAERRRIDDYADEISVSK